MFGFYHFLGKNLRRQKRSDKVQVEDKLNAVGIQLKKGRDVLFCALVQILGEKIFLARCAAGVVSARAVDEDIDASEFRKDFVARFLKACFLQNVGRNGKRFSSVGDDLIDDLLRRFGIQVKHGDLCAARGDRLGKARAKHSAAARDDCGLARKIDMEG